MSSIERLKIIDSHTGGEPTRVIIAGGPDLGTGPLTERRARMAAKFDRYRTAVINEPRGSDVIVGALLVPPTDSRCVAGVIYFNNAGYLNMCGHGTIGVTVTLAHLGRITPGKHLLETPVGIVGIEYHGDNRVTFDNVPSYRWRADVEVDVPGYGKVVGDVSWGGNWFFLIKEHSFQIALSEVKALTDFTSSVRTALQKQNITGYQGAKNNSGEIDHIEMFGPPVDPKNNCRNFMLCPGMAYDRSPCGTGTSAKLASLAAADKLSPGETWRQESIVGSLFEAKFSWLDDSISGAEDASAIGAKNAENRLDSLPPGIRAVLPKVTGTAYVNSEADFLIDKNDPFGYGIQ